MDHSEEPVSNSVADSASTVIIDLSTYTGTIDASDVLKSSRVVREVSDDVVENPDVVARVITLGVERVAFADRSKSEHFGEWVDAVANCTAIRSEAYHACKHVIIAGSATASVYAQLGTRHGTFQIAKSLSVYDARQKSLLNVGPALNRSMDMWAASGVVPGDPFSMNYDLEESEQAPDVIVLHATYSASRAFGQGNLAGVHAHYENVLGRVASIVVLPVGPESGDASITDETIGTVVHTFSNALAVAKQFRERAGGDRTVLALSSAMPNAATFLLGLKAAETAHGFARVDFAEYLYGTNYRVVPLLDRATVTV